MPPLDPVIRRRRIRRLVLLGALLLLSSGGVMALYAVQRSRHVDYMEQQVEESAQAYADEDYERVIELLEDRNNSMNVIRIIQNDPEALYHYVNARSNVPINNGEHLALLMPALQQVVTLSPENYDAGYLLLVLLKTRGRNTEALSVNDRLIEVHPNDAELLRIRADTHRHLNDPALALEDALASAAIEPMNVRTQMDVADLILLTRSDPSAFIERSQALFEAHPEDPRAELILTQALLLRGDRLGANAHLLSAAQRPAPSDDFAQVLANVLDETNQFESAHAYLQRVASEGLETPLQNRLLYRDFEAEDDRAVLDRLAHLQRNQMLPDLLAVGAISARRLGDGELSHRYLEALKSRADDPLATHWWTCLEARWADPIQLGRVVAAASAACKDYPNQPYLQNMLGEAYRSVGEFEAALRAFEAAINSRPTWSVPYYTSGEVYLAQGNLRPAERDAVLALRRKTNALHAGLVVDIRSRMVEAGDDADRERVLAYIDGEILAQVPGEPRSTLVAIRLQARVGDKQDALARLRVALSLDPPLPMTALVDLGEISRTYGLGYEERIAEVSREAHGLSPQMILSQAQRLFNEGNGQAGLDLIRASMPSPAPLLWRVSEAQFMDQIGDADASSHWIELADAESENLQIQQLALASVGVQADRQFADRAIKRMRELAGEDSVGWKINRARYWLGASDPAASAREAQELLEQAIRDAPNRVEAYRLLARCQTLRSQFSAAIHSIEQAAGLVPDDLRIQFQLGQLLHADKQFEAARRPLQHVANDPQADPNMRLHAFLLLANQGETRTLIPILEGFREQYITPDEQEILLASLYQAVSRLQDAESICASMLEDPSPAGIAFVADYYFRRGDVAASSEVIALVHTLEMPDDIRSTILGQHAARLGELAVALDHYRAAANSAPGVAARWHNLVILGLVFGQPTQAIADAQSAVVHHPNDAGLNAIVQHADLIGEIAGDIRFRPIAATLVKDDEFRAVGIQSLQSVVDASRSGISTGTLAARLAKLADENPRYLQLQNLATNMLSAVRRYDLAGEIATRAMMNFPGDAESARMATIAFANTGDWPNVIAATESWTRRNPGQKSHADVYLAAAQRGLGRVDDALETLAPYIGPALEDPQANQRVISEYITALVLRGRTNDAWRMLESNLSKDAAWRSLAVDLASNVVTSRRDAQLWLSAAEQETPLDDTYEILLLTQGYFNAGTRLRDDGFVAKARDLSDMQITQSDVPSAAWMLRGQLTTFQGDLRNAELSYREVLKIERDSIHAKNNLAMVLVSRGQNLNQAVRLAQEVVDAQPDTPNWLDTLAQVQSAAGQHDAALLTIEQAIRLDRLSMQWLTTKANVLEAAGRVQEAQALREQFDLSVE